ncbi:hypothetical protein BDQ17DRAFT_1437632 [Cyathus striatus]|nr:hypothetical protein BDQ17DRAFT_1437632 [Cyathus striatus]
MDDTTSIYFLLPHWLLLSCTPALTYNTDSHTGTASLKTHATTNILHFPSGKWWWVLQTSLEKNNPGATIVPITISTDKT